MDYFCVFLLLVIASFFASTAMFLTSPHRESQKFRGVGGGSERNKFLKGSGTDRGFFPVGLKFE